MLLLMGASLVAPAWSDIGGAKKRARIRALVVGISAYKTQACWDSLEGVRDAAMFRSCLLTRYQALPEQITTLPEEKTTREGIEAALQDLVRESKPGEQVIFYYAGHGAVVLDETGEDADGLNECFVCIDAPSFRDATFKDHVVRDKFMGNILARLLEKVRPQGGPQGSVVLVLDSCHSGGMSKGGKESGRKTRSNPAVIDYFLKQIAQSGRKSRARSEHLRESKLPRTGWVLLAACRPDQSTFDTPSFTQKLTEALNDKRITPTSDYHDLMQLVGASLQSDFQMPQSEGDCAMTLLGGAAQPRPPAIQVKKVEQVGDELLLSLDKGSVLGLTVGTKLAVYRFSARSRKDVALRLGDAEIVSSDPYESAARFTGGPAVKAEDLNNSLAWVTSLSMQDRELKLYVDARFPTAKPYQELRVKLLASVQGLVKQVQDPRTADLALWGTTPEGQPGGVSLERLMADSPRSRLASGEPTSPKTLDDLTTAMTAEVRRSYLMKMTTTDPELEAVLVPGRFVGNSQSDFKPDGDTPALAVRAHLGEGGVLTFHDHQQALLEITNQGQRPLYVSVVNVDGSGNMKVVYPLGNEITKAVQPGENHKLLVDLGFAMSATERARGEQIEGFKIIGTTQPVDFVYLASRGEKSSTRDPRKSTDNPLGSLMGALMDGNTRGGRGSRGARGAESGGASPPMQSIRTDECVMLPPLWVRVKP